MRIPISTPRPTFFAIALSICFWPGLLPAQNTPIGLSEVRGQWFESHAPAFGDQFAFSLATGDFNGDGADDLATGSPYADDPEDGGSVLVRYGSPGGGIQAPPPPQVLRRGPALAEPLDFYGRSLAAGDFNGDGFDDLAIGIPWAGPTNRGAVEIHFGWADGLLDEFEEEIDELSAGEPLHACDDSHFGYTLEAGNFDGDAFDDLAIGAPWGCERKDLFSLVPGGSVFVAHGQEWGLLPWWGYRISQDSPGLFDEVEEYDRFAYALAAGDFNGDGFDDLAIGVVWEDSGGVEDAGAIQNIMGSTFGLIFTSSVFWLPGALGDAAEEYDGLGTALEAGDFDGDGHDDLAIGIPGENLGPDEIHFDTGQVDIAYGAADPFWFDLARTENLVQSAIYGNELHDGSGDEFGWAFATGDFDGDGRDDLAIGHQKDDWPGIDHGAVTILMGATPSLGSSTRFRLIGVGSEGIPGNAAQHGQYSGAALASGDFDDDGFADLAIGVPRFDRGNLANSGGETILYGALFADGFEVGTIRWSNTVF